MKLVFAVLIAFAVLPGTARAQTPQPYAGLETRRIKALSDQQIDDLKSGRGMGLALAAELNGYPGPSHVLELGDRLDLSQTQRARMQSLFDAMKREAVELGERLIAEEAELDGQFVGRSITEARLTASLQAIGATQAALRAAHLKYHLATAEVLTPQQMQQYSELRGYGTGAPVQHHHGGDGGHR